MNKPQLIDLQNAKDHKGGSLSFIEGQQLPFDIQRVYWIYGVKKGDERGGHAHKNSERLLVCTSGAVEILLENTKGEKYTFLLDNPSKGLFFPSNHWINITFKDKSVLMVLVSCTYAEDVYLTDYQQFLEK